MCAGVVFLGNKMTRAEDLFISYRYVAEDLRLETIHKNGQIYIKSSLLHDIHKVPELKGIMCKLPVCH